MYEQISAKDNKIIELSEELVALKRQVWDLEEGLKEKDEIISARTAAVGLASASLAAKGWCSNSVVMFVWSVWSVVMFVWSNGVPCQAETLWTSWRTRGRS